MLLMYLLSRTSRSCKLFSLFLYFSPKNKYCTFNKTNGIAFICYNHAMQFDWSIVYFSRSTSSKTSLAGQVPAASSSANQPSPPFSVTSHPDSPSDVTSNRNIYQILLSVYSYIKLLLDSRLSERMCEI